MRILMAAALVACVAAVASAQPAPAAAGDAPFEARMHKEADGKTLPYRLLAPKAYKATERYPLVIWMHGSGERGTDNRRQLTNVVTGTFLAEPARTKYPCFVLVPQASLQSGWIGAHLNKVAPVTDTIRMLLATIVELEKEFKIDARRIYVGGFSAGAFGTWELISRYPELAAAAFHMAGTPPGWEKICLRLRRVPIWIFHGEKDNMAPVEASRAVYAALKQGGGNVRYTEYPGASHGDAATKGLAEPGFMEWLFAQKRAAPASLEPVKDPENSVVITKTMLPGTHGTWKGPVQRTLHNAPRIAIDGFRYRLRAPKGAGEAIVATLEGISKGTIKGNYEVTGTVVMDDAGYMSIDVESLKPVE
jgi:poly(3-hydroxybutyrate) depolymerase